MSPTASGQFAGILIFGSRSDTAVTYRINGNAGSTLYGAIHAPASSMRYSGNFGGSGGCTQIDEDRITFTGNSDLAVGAGRIADRRRDRPV